MQQQSKLRLSKILQYAVFLFGGLMTCHVFAADTDQPDPALCRALVKHTPDADVAYQPGVDVEGNPVAPADVPGSPQMKMPEKIEFPITVSLAKVLNLNTGQYPYNQLGTGTEGQIGKITVEGEKVFLDGQPITDTQQDNLAVLCMQPSK